MDEKIQFESHNLILESIKLYLHEKLQFESHNVILKSIKNVLLRKIPFLISPLSARLKIQRG